MPLNIYNASFFSRLRDAFDIKGKHEFKLDEVMVPVVVVQDLSTETSSEPSDCFYNFFVAASGVAPSTALLENPVGSGSIILVDRITTGSPANLTIDITQTVQAPVAPIAGGSADKGWNDATLPSVPPGVMFGDSGTPWVGDEVYSMPHVAGRPTIIDVRLVLQPGQLIAIQSVLNNTFLRVYINARIVRIL